MLVDRKRKSVYMTGLRNGSTLMEEIKDLVGPDRLYRHQYHEDLVRLISEDRAYKIYMPFRDPMIRFKSGLTVNMYNRCGFDTEDGSFKAQDSTYAIYKQLLTYLDNTAGNDHAIFDLTRCRPYHLYDTHTDHLLYQPLIYLAYGFDVQLIPFNNFSEHLLQQFPEAKDIIVKRGRPNSFNTSLKEHELAWNIYKEIFIDNEPDFYKSNDQVKFQTFNLWMKPEIEIFNLFMENYQQINMLKTRCRGLIIDFTKNTQYFNDPYSPKFMRLGSLLPMIERFNKLNPQLQNFSQNYSGITNHILALDKFTDVGSLPKPLY